VYDIQGNFAGSKIGGTGNWQNPVALKKREIGNYWANSRIFGNLWAEADLYKGLTYRTSYGLDWTENYHYRMSKKNLEFSESGGQNDLEEQAGFTFRWVWTNTLTYNATFNNVHKVNVILGTEAIRDGLGRQVTAQRYNYLYEDNVNTWVLAMGENNNQRVANSEYRGEFALFGIFGRVDYSFANKYLLTGIVRRDGVSRFSPSNRYGTFPSLSLGWRLSEENFLESTREWLDDLKFRIGYGQTGNSEVPRKTNFAYEFTTAADRTNYDLSGSNNASGTLGYRLQRYGNEDTKWEATEMYNVGIDATILNGKFGIGAEWYTKKTKDMLLEATYSSLAGESDKPYINFGDMKNTGWDINLNYRDANGDWAWDLSLILSHYKNEVLKLSEADDYAIWRGGTRISGNVTRTTKGRPIAEFYGYKVAGFYENEAEVLALPPLGQTKETVVPSAWVGKFKFEDVNQDGEANKGVLNANDRTTLGSPHPDLIASLNLGLTYKNFDFTMFWYSTIGNKLFNNTKYFTDFFLFGGNRSTRMRDLSWKPGADNSKAILPLLDSGDTYSGSNMSSYYVEDASFLRLKNVVIGYTFPKALLQKATISNLRVYAQIENALTFTGYSGLDPEFTNANVSDGNGSDLSRGIDMGGWPTTMRILFGVNFAF
jgi:TonB-linked SusC/RagA family outer membrane protein